MIVKTNCYVNEAGVTVTAIISLIANLFQNQDLIILCCSRFCIWPPPWTRDVVFVAHKLIALRRQGGWLILYKISFRYYANQKRTLEVNPRHPLVKELLKRVETDKEDKTAKDLARVLFETATLRSGYMVKVGVISFNPWQPNIIIHIPLAVLFRFLQYQQWEFV